MAEELFVSEGYDNVSMRKIAARIEYSPTTIYRHFENKAAIMKCLIADGYRRVQERYRIVLDRDQDSPLTTLGEIIRVYVEFAVANPNHYELWFASSEMDVVDGQLQMRHGDSSYTVYQVWLDHIEQSRAMGLFPGQSTLTVFQLIWGAVHGLISLRIRHPRLPWLPLPEHLDELLAMIDRGLTTSEERVRPDRPSAPLHPTTLGPRGPAKETP